MHYCDCICVTDKDASRLLCEIDSKKDGVIDFEEFCTVRSFFLNSPVLIPVVQLLSVIASHLCTPSSSTPIFKVIKTLCFSVISGYSVFPNPFWSWAAETIVTGKTRCAV